MNLSSILLVLNYIQFKVAAIASRGDLKGIQFGAVDTKVLDLNLIKSNLITCQTISGIYHTLLHRTFALRIISLFLPSS
jgi:hypothetical protein